MTRGLAFDPHSKAFFAAIAWNGIAKMALPEKGAPRSAWKWNILIRRAAGPTVPSIGSFLLEDERALTSIPLVNRPVDFYSYDVAVGGPDLLYASDGMMGYTFAVDLKTGRTSRITGFAVGTEGTQLALNRRLDAPRRIGGISDGHIYFGDFFGIHRVNLSSESKDRMIELFAKGDTVPFAIDSVGKKILRQTAFNQFEVVSLDQRGNGPLLASFSPDVNFPRGYLIQGSLQFIGGKPYQWHWMSDWDGITVRKSSLAASSLPALPDSVWSSGNISSGGVSGGEWKLVSHPNYYGVGYQGLEKTNCKLDPTCVQVPITPATINVQGKDYRGANRTGGLGWRSPVGSPVFLDPSRVFGCVVDGSDLGVFAVIEIGGFGSSSEAPVIHFVNVQDGTSSLSCSETETQFALRDGNVYFNAAGGIYQLPSSALNPSGVKARLTVSASQVQFAPGWKLPPYKEYFRGLYVEPDYVYVSDPKTNRVLRVKRR
jgi:hypothetical protein